MFYIFVFAHPPGILIKSVIVGTKNLSHLKILKHFLVLKFFIATQKLIHQTDNSKM